MNGPTGNDRPPPPAVIDTRPRRELMVDADHFVYVDGVKIARLVEFEGARCLEFLDKDRRRSSRRGTDRVSVAVKELLEQLGT